MMGMMANEKEMINLQIQNLISSLQNISFQMNNNLIACQDLLVIYGFGLINKGIQILNIYLQSLSLPMGMNFNLQSQVQNVGFDLQNLVMQLQKYEFNQNIGNLNLNFGMSPFNQGINMMMNQNNQNIPQKNIKTIYFKTPNGRATTVNLPISFTVKQAIDKFYERNPQLYPERKHIFFLYNAFKIKESDENKAIKDYFKSLNPETVMVIDVSFY